MAPLMDQYLSAINPISSSENNFISNFHLFTRKLEMLAISPKDKVAIKLPFLK